MKSNLVSDEKLYGEAILLFQEIGLRLTIRQLYDEWDKHEGFQYVLLDYMTNPKWKATAYTNRRKIPKALEYKALNRLIEATGARKKPVNFWELVEWYGGVTIPFETALEGYIEYMKTQGRKVVCRKAEREELKEKYMALYARSNKRLPNKFTLQGKTSLQVVKELSR